MRFLADESCDHAVVRALRQAGHAVDAVAEISPADDDQRVLARAARTKAVLLSEDHDFGRLVFAEGRPSSGVILLRMPVVLRATIGDIMVRLVAEHGDRLHGRFVVVEPGRVRISPLNLKGRD